jgi:hypothetical protein
MGLTEHDDSALAVVPIVRSQRGAAGALDLISIADQVTWSFVSGSLRDLMCDPPCSQMQCHVDP